VYSEEVQETNGTDETQDDTKETNDDTLPGFGILLSMIAMLGAALISTRKK
jgi:PGF-CTERM protein